MYKLLIVDDDYIAREGLRDLKDWAIMGIEIAGEAENGQDALEKARNIHPDIILTDVVMPVMDGIKLAETLRIEQPDIKIIMISAHQDIHYVKAAMKLEAIDYILKPFNMEELNDVVSKVTDKLKKEEQEKRMSTEVKLFFNESIPLVASSDVVELKEQILTLFGTGQTELLENISRSFFNILRQKKMNSILFLTAICTDLLAKAARRIPMRNAPVETASFFKDLGLIEDSFTMEDKVVKRLVYMDKLVQESKDNKSRKVIRNVESIINKRFDQDITIQQLADEVFMSPGHLQALFKKDTGQTINDYITSVRIEKAKDLLKDPAIKIYEVAYRVGYHDSNYFAKTFRKLVGISPMDYRESVV